MARAYRLQGENCFYHITSRGDDRKKIFLSGTDYEKFLEYLEIAKDRFRFHLYAYCLMGNHYHLFIETLQPNLSKIMQYINTSYTVYYNKKRKKTGHLFQGRYKSIMVDEDSYFLELTRYIHLNPVKAKIISLPQEYKWSSYKGYLKEKDDKYINYSEIKSYLGMSRSEYRDFVLSGINKKGSLFKGVYAGSFLGGRDFVKDKLAELKPDIEAGDFAHKRKLISDISIDDIVEETSKIFKQTREGVIGKKNSRAISRKVAIYVTKRVTPLTNKEIGGYFKLSDSAVGKTSAAMREILNDDRDLKQAVNAIFSVFRV